jgi:hypothetical protein
VSEAHQARAVGAVLLGALDELARGDALVADRGQHLDHLLVRAAVGGTPERLDARRDRGEEVDERGADQPHRRGRAVLLVVGVQDEEQVDRLVDHRIDAVGLARRREHHVQEVRDVGELVARIQEGLPDRVLVGVGRHRRHLRQQPVHRDLEVARIARVERIRVEGGQRADGRRARGHRVRVLRQEAEEAPEVLVEHRVDADRADEVGDLLARRQLPVDQQVRDLEEVAALGQLLDRVAAVAQDALLAVDEGDGGAAGAGVGVAWVERDETRLVSQLADVDGAFALAALDDGQLDDPIADAQLCEFGHGSHSNWRDATRGSDGRRSLADGPFRR